MTPPSSSTDAGLQDICLDDDAHAEQQHPSTRPPCLRGPVHEILLVIVAAFIGATFLVLQRGTIVITESLKHSLSLSASGTTWITASSGLTAGVFFLPLAHIADRCPHISRRTFLLGSLALFSIVTGLTALCQDGIVLDVMLGLAGVIAAAQLPIMSGLLTSIYAVPSTRLHCIFTLFLAGGNFIAVVFGGISFGIVATSAKSWRASFVYIAVLFVIILVLAVLTIPDLPKDKPYSESMDQCPDEQYALLGTEHVGAMKRNEIKADYKSIAKSIDWLGLHFLLTGVGCFSVGLTQAPEDNWQSPWIVVMFIYSAMCVFGFYFWESYTDTPMVPRAIWQNCSLLLTLISTLCLSMSFFSTLFWVSFFMQEVQGLSSLQVSIRLLPQAVTGLLLSPMIGWWMHKIPNQFILFAAALCQMGASVLLLFLREHSNYFTYVFPSLILSTLSIDWVRNVGAQFIANVLPLTDQIAGAAILQIVTRLGIPLGMGITTVIWSSTEPSYTTAFSATAVFAAIALVVSPFARVGKLGIASTASLSSHSAYTGHLPTLVRQPLTSVIPTNSGLQNLNHDGPTHTKTNMKDKRLSQLIQPRSSSLAGVKAWKNRLSRGASSSIHLPLVSGNRNSAIAVGLSKDLKDESRRLSQQPQRTSTAMAARVIWLVCEECGSSKRIVEAIGDPDKYFYDASWVDDCVVTELNEDDPSASVSRKDDGNGTSADKRRFSLLRGPIQPNA
ncbi:hypothetical protein VPNG_07726 [Cytospora leucostoma]|uniref:Major facilitator superfamily (MFS) profile domain-containing protein n=1 Tax=Cytospora leucostoma TaxID=1230097 RepID=A0A423W892_9PEZI|nr:hypothetical protein VPNG_07726 [Cytospora leucostoma]